MRAVSCLLYLPVTFKTLISCNLFNTVSCLNVFGHLFIVVSTCMGTLFVEESIVSLPIFNLEFFPLLSFRVGNDDEKVIITFGFLYVESLKKWAIFWDYNYFIPVSPICSTEILKAFRSFVPALHSVKEKTLKSSD